MSDAASSSTTNTPQNPKKRKADAVSSGISPSWTPNKRARVRAFYMPETYGVAGEKAFTSDVRSKIVCTIGPVSCNEDTLRQFVLSGMSVARLNFSHGTHEWFAETISKIRSVAEELNRPVAIMQDTKGPEVRTGKLVGGEPITLEKGTTFTLSTDMSLEGDVTQVAVTYPHLPEDLELGDSVLLDDGLIRLKVTEIHDDRVVTTVENTGKLGEKKGVNTPGRSYSKLPAVTEKDIKDIAFGVAQNVDIIAASFIRSASNVEAVRSQPGVKEAGIAIVSKIESSEGLANFEEILAASDGIMVARGDLGVETPLERVNIEQKRLVSQCNQVGKPVIVATQMLESMCVNPRPTRAEASDVSNAVFDGTDAVMLSGESAGGRYPVESVQTLGRIALATEAELDFLERYERTRRNALALTPVLSHSEAIASSAVKTALDIDAKLIIVLTESGRTARLISKYNPRAYIIAVTDVQKTAAQLLLTRSVTPIHIHRSIEINDEVIRVALFEAMEMEIVLSGDSVVVVSGTVAGQSGGSNTVRTLVVP